MKKYTLTIELIVLADSDEDAVQKGLNIAKNERDKYDNQCTLTKAQVWVNPIQLETIYTK
jgi:hypothetical protein